MLDVPIVIENLQAQLNSLNTAVSAQQASIDQLTDLVLELVEARDARAH